MTRIARVFSLVPVLTLAVLAQVSPDINNAPSRAFGQAKLLTDLVQTPSPNLLEGRELNSPTAIAFDTTASPPIVYVADTGNHRILAWRNPASLTLGNQADKVIGQRNFYGAFEGGPGRNGGGLTAAGLSLPNGLAVDGSGNLWVFDAGNNRIVRFPRPLEQGDLVAPDLVIGQKTISSGISSNEGLPKPSEKTLSSNRFGSAARAALAFDADGNLWVADPLNHRVLRFPKGRLNTNEPAADLVLGQNAFDLEVSTDTQGVLTSMNRPSALAFDARGGLLVADSLARVLYYDAFVTGGSARRLLGAQPTVQGQTRPPVPNDYSLGLAVGGGSITIQCVVTVDNVPYICDTAAHRMAQFAASDAWPAATNTVLSPVIAQVYGQDTLLAGGVNRSAGATKPQSNSLAFPGGGAVFNGEMWIADTGNNRVVVLPISSQGGGLNAASRVLGQPQFDTNSPNLVDGRELFIYDQNFHGVGLAIDRTSTPNRLYVADSQNNRVLGFKDVRTVGTDVRTLLTQPADIVIGQPDRFHTGLNYPTGDPLLPTDQGLSRPSGVAVDAQGNLWVADSFNGRLLRFPAPFSQPTDQVQKANLVLGQFNFTTSITDASASTMNQPMGVAVFNNGDLAASDYNHNRILLFRKNGADFTNGQAARAVLGQPNFNTTTAASSAAGLNRPRGLAVDSSDRLYVADALNNRVIVYSSTSTINSGATGTSIPGIGQPEGVAVSPSTGEVWVAASGSNQIYRFREFTQLGNPAPTATLNSVSPMAIVLDQFDNVIVAEALNRLTFYYAQMVYRHAATYASGSNLQATMTPGLYALIGRLGKDFEFTPATGSIPYPKTLGGLQLLVNGTPAPITNITSNVIYFLVPNNAPSSGDAEFLLTKPETGEILAAGSFTMGPAAPGFFTTNQQGTRQIAATNENGTPNSSTNTIGQDQVLTLWMTGYGHLDNAPPDGEPAGRALETDVKPVIILGGTYTVPPSKILYSGVSPQYPGLWQVNIRMPKNGELGAPAPSNTLSVLMLMRDVPSNNGGTSTFGFDQRLQVSNGLITTIAFK